MNDKTVPEIVLNWPGVENMSPDEKAQLVMRYAELWPPHIQQSKALAVKRSRDRMQAMMAGMPAWEPRGINGLKKAEILAGEATPQTRNKVRRDVVIGLVKKGVLEAQHMDAVVAMREIEEAYRVSGGCSWLVERVQGGKWVAPVERRSRRLQDIYRNFYLPWLAWLVDEPIKQVTTRRTVVYLVAAHFVRLVVLDNHSVTAAEKRCRITPRKGIGACVLRIALDRYQAIQSPEQYDSAAEISQFENAA